MLRSKRASTPRARQTLPTRPMRMLQLRHRHHRPRLLSTVVPRVQVQLGTSRRRLLLRASRVRIRDRIRIRNRIASMRATSRNTPA
jgi:hypothetical protein